MMLKVGIVSGWHVHANEYAERVMESKKAEITAVWDEEEGRGKKLAEKYGVPFFPDYDEFLQKGDFSAIICDAPTTMHEMLLVKAAQAGKHIFTEKLLATTTKSAQKIVTAVKDSGVIFTLSLPLLANAKILYARQLIESGELGRVTGARMRRSHGGVSDGWLPDYWFDVEKSGGGALMDLGAHPVYVLASLFGEPKRVSGILTNLYGTSSDENSVALVEFGDGVIGICETAFVTFGVPDLLEIYGTEGSVFFHGDKILVSTKKTDALNLGEKEPAHLPEALAHPVIQFLDACIEGKKSPEYLDVDSGLIMTKIIEAAYAADRTNKTECF